MIGDFRTDALHQALDNEAIGADTLIGLLVLALGSKNVSIENGIAYGRDARDAIPDRISDAGVLTADPVMLHAAAREMLKMVFSCRTNMTDSGICSRIAGESLGASDVLPNMATDAFLSCLSRQALERNAAGEGVKVEVRVKDTRTAMVTHFKDKIWRFPGAFFALSDEERASAAARTENRTDGSDADDTEADGSPRMPNDEPSEVGDGDISGSDEAGTKSFSVAAE